MQSVLNNKISRIIALWAALALVAGVTLVVVQRGKAPADDPLRKLEDVRLISHTATAILALTGYVGTDFVGVLQSSDPACVEARTVTVFLDNVGSIPDPPVASGVTLSDGSWSASYPENPAGIQVYYAVVSQKIYITTGFNIHTCGSGTSNGIAA